MKTWDVIIIGSGPAGSATALYLLQENPGWAARILILEQAVHPRPKLCGGGITEMGRRHLRQLGIELDIPGFDVTNAILRFGRKVISILGKPIIRVIQRAELDQQMLQEVRKQGVEVHEGEKVLNLERELDYVRIHTDKQQYHGRVVVAADGSSSITRRKLIPKRKRSRTARTLEVIRPVEADDELQRSRTAVFDFTPMVDNLQGYIWDFPCRQTGALARNSGIYDARIVAYQRATLPVLLKDHLENAANSSDTPKYQGHPIHLFSPWNRFSSAKILLVGDSAGVDGLFGEGIGPAFAYGQIAAQAIQAAFDKKRFQFRYYRLRLMCSALGGYLLIRWLGAHVLYYARGSKLWIHFLWIVVRLLARLIPGRTAQSETAEVGKI